jgi:hypothetical protein
MVVKENPDGTKILVFLGSEDLPELGDVIGPRPERLEDIKQKELDEQME